MIEDERKYESKKMVRRDYESSFLAKNFSSRDFTDVEEETLNIVLVHYDMIIQKTIYLLK